MPNLIQTDAYQAITIWQPWATLIAEGLKCFEFRGWPPPKALWGTRIAIHAGARPVRRNELCDLVLKLHSLSWQETGINRDAGLALLEPMLSRGIALPLSSVLCTAMLGTPIRNEVLAAELGLRRINDSDRDEHTNWGWPLGEIEQLRPFVPARGSQGFWTWRNPSLPASPATPDRPGPTCETSEDFATDAAIHGRLL